MKLKELKAIIDGCDDDINVVVSDVTDKSIQIVGGGEISTDGLHLYTRQEFPESWFKDQKEVRWIKGAPVIPKAIEETEVILLKDKDLFGVLDEIAVRMVFRDGFATGDGIGMKYPKLSELTDLQSEQIDEYCGGRISDSGVITPFDVCLLFGKVDFYGIMDSGNGHDPNLVQEINKKWVLFKDRFRPILCALYERDIDEITDADSFRIDKWFPKYGNNLCPAAFEKAYWKGVETDDWAEFNDLALKDMCKDWDLFAENYLMHIADDQDLDTILTYVRYDKCEDR